MVAGAARRLVERSSVPGGRSTREPAVGSCESLLGPCRRGWTAESRHPTPAPSGRRDWLGKGRPNSPPWSAQDHRPRPAPTPRARRRGPTRGSLTAACGHGSHLGLTQKPRVSEGLTTISGLAPGAASPGPAAPSGPRLLLAPTLPLQRVLQTRAA
ncbi:hypothetical protein R6Z07F_001906 [Ovis aries]